MTASTNPNGLSGTTLGRYRLGSLLGRGGMGEVYRAEDMELGRQVAIKVLPPAFTGDPERLARFVQEARTASSLNHPHLVSIYEIGSATPQGRGNAVQFIAMELVEGETLREWITGRRGNLKRTLEYLTQAAEALAAAHGAGIVHRDLKPENLMIAQAGYAKVLDFGLAKLRVDAPSAGGLTGDPTVTGGVLPGTSPGVVMGTVGYMSPEQAQGLRVDHRSDIFSFGCLLYEAITTARPFAGTTAVDTLHNIIHAQPRPVTELAPACPPELQRIARKCLAKSPDDRYQTMKDVALDLKDLCREMDSGSSPSLVMPAVAPSSRSRLPWAAAVLAVVLAGAAGAWHWRSTPAPSTSSTGALTHEQVTATGLVIDATMSRDGNYVVYVESQAGRQKLLLRQMRGSRPLELAAPAGGFWGIEFTPDGSAVYYSLKNSTETLGALYSIPTLGGTPRRILSTIDSKVTFSPDGQRIAYLRVEPDGSGASSLMVARATGEDARALVTKRPPEFFAPTFFAAASWSPDGKRIVAPLRNTATHDARLASYDVEGGTEALFPQAYAYASFAQWLPDGSGIVVAARMPDTYTTGNGGQLYLQPFPSGEVRRITSDLVEYRNASFTADGKSLLTVAFEASAFISLIPFGGSDERRIVTDRTAGATGLTWTPDGSRVYYVRNVRNQLQIWSSASDGTDAREAVLDVRFGGVAITRDGEWLLYSAQRGSSGGLWKARTDGSSPQLLVTVADPTSIATSPDGRHVYFTSSREGSPATFTVPVAGGEPVRVAGLFERAAPSPDGRLLAGMYRAETRAPYAVGVLNAMDGSVVNVLPNLRPASGGTSFGWTADGRNVLFTTAERSNIWSWPVTGGPVEKITNFSERAIARFALSPDGKTLALCRGQVMRDAVLLTNFR